MVYFEPTSARVVEKMQLAPKNIREHSLLWWPKFKSWENILLKLLNWGLASVFLQKTESNYFRLCGQVGQIEDVM